jgi:hypothetical protein
VRLDDPSVVAEQYAVTGVEFKLGFARETGEEAPLGHFRAVRTAVSVFVATR